MNSKLLYDWILTKDMQHINMLHSQKYIAYTFFFLPKNKFIIKGLLVHYIVYRYSKIGDFSVASEATDDWFDQTPGIRILNCWVGDETIRRESP